MKNRKKSHFAISVLFIAMVFLLGYWQGQESVLDLNSGQVVALNLIASKQNSNPNMALQSNQQQVPLANTSNKETKRRLIENENSSQANNVANNNILSQLSANATATELLEILIDIAGSENNEDMQYFSKIMDRLRVAVKEDPLAIQALLSRYLNADTEDKDPFYIISILQGADIPNREQIFIQLAQQLASEASQASQEKLLHLASSTGLQDKHSEVSNMITDIALYGNPNIQNKLYALDLLMPYQLNQNEKYTVVNDLKQALPNMSEDHKSYAIEHMMRFSNQNDRGQMAKTFLSTSNDLSTRIAVLSSLHSGTLSPSSNLKSQLFSIAQDKADPLNQHAKHALMNVFDISNDDYIKLNNG